MPEDSESAVTDWGPTEQLGVSAARTVSTEPATRGFLAPITTASVSEMRWPQRSSLGPGTGFPSPRQVDLIA